MPQATSVVKESDAPALDARVSPLLKRAFMFLEDGDFDRADDFCEQVLNIDPECAEAYLGKLMVELKVRTRERLKNCKEPFTDRNNYQKVLRFAGDQLREEVTGYVDYIVNRNNEAIYAPAVEKMKTAGTEAAWKLIATALRSVPGYKNSDELVAMCEENAEIARKDAQLDSAIALMARQTEDSYATALAVLHPLRGYKNADELAETCKKCMQGEQKDNIYRTANSLKARNTVDGLTQAIEHYEQIPGWRDADEQALACRQRLAELKATINAKIASVERTNHAKQTILSIPAWFFVGFCLLSCFVYPFGFGTILLLLVAVMAAPIKVIRNIWVTVLGMFVSKTELGTKRSAHIHRIKVLIIAILYFFAVGLCGMAMVDSNPDVSDTPVQTSESSVSD